MTGASHGRRVLTIPPGVAFLPAFAEALVNGRIITGFPDRTDPLSLGSAKIYVPTRRAARALTAEIARVVGGAATILPEIVPLGAMEGMETAALFSAAEEDFARPDAVSELERRLTLAKLILAWSRHLRHAIRHVDMATGKTVTDPDEFILVTSSPAQAFRLAADLGALIDEMTIEGIDPQRLKGLASDSFDKYWAITLEFLKIAFEQWPLHLQERGLEDRARRQSALVEHEISRLKSGMTSGPQIVIGSTGTNLATAQLIATIAALPAGAVVLPGLDQTLDEGAWAAIGGAEDGATDTASSHPQAALRKLLGIIGIGRSEVEEISAPDSDLVERMDLLREALRPAETTGSWLQWRKAKGDEGIKAALEGVSFVEAEDERQEALAIAIALRKALNTNGATAALVTPDRSLARRVRSELLRWNIDVDDSGGDPLSKLPAGICAALALQCAEQNTGSTAVLALLDHEHVRLGYTEAEFRRLRLLAETAVLRGTIWNMDEPARGLETAQALANEPHAHPVRRDISDDDWTALGEFFERLREACAPMRSLGGEQPLSVWFEAHWQMLSRLQQTSADEPFYASEDWTELQGLFDAFIGIFISDFNLALPAYTALFNFSAQEAIVRGPRRTHPRIKILGLLEARLLSADLMILAGLDEAVWPPAASTDAFLNRPMRARLGMSSPERRIGQTAHDFVEACGAPEILLTRSKKRDGSPTVPSRFIQRIQALAGNHWTDCKYRGDEFLQLAAIIDKPVNPAGPVKRPAPKPALELRPLGLSITQIETWRRDPYSIYAQHILQLQPLDELDAEDGAAEFGTALHDVLAEFQTRRPAGLLPPEAVADLTTIAEQRFESQLGDADFRTFRWPPLLSFFEKYIEWENGRRERNIKIITEKSGRLPVTLQDGSVFTLRGRADRFEIAGNGEVTILDFKSGRTPTKAEINAGFAPQLTLEAAMIKEGAFASVPAGSKICEAIYVSVGRDEDIKNTSVDSKQKTFEDLVAEHYAGLMQLANQFRDPQTPYLSRPIPQFVSRYGTYDHLARVKEWSAINGEGEE